MNKLSFDFAKPICRKCELDCDSVLEQIRQEDFWEQRRYEIARDFMCCHFDPSFTKEYIAKASIDQADELIKQLKGE